MYDAMSKQKAYDELSSSLCYFKFYDVQSPLHS